MKTNCLLFVFSVLCFFSLVSLADAGQTVTLEQAIRQAREQSITLKQAEKQIRAAEARARETRTYLYPSLGFSGTYDWQKGWGAADTAGVENDYNSLALGITQPVYTGQRLQKEFESAAITAELARLDYRLAETDLVFQVRSAYFSALRLKKTVSVAGELVNNRQRHLSEVEKRVKVGVLPKVEQLKSEVGLAHSQDVLYSAENNYSFSRSLLNRLLENPIDTVLVLEEITVDTGTKPSAPDYYYAQARQNRPEIEAARLDAVQAEKGVSIARSGYYPQVSLQLSHQENQADAFDSDWHDYNEAALVFSCDIWNWGRNREKVNTSRNLLEQARLNQQKVERNIALEVKNAYLAVVSARTRIVTAEKAIDQAEETLKMQTIRFKEGMATNTEVLDADFALSQTKNDYFNAVYDFYQAETALNKSIGRLE